MNIKCKLLGHKFEKIDEKESVETSGDKKVMVTKKIMECGRCGEIKEQKLKTKVFEKNNQSEGDETSKSNNSENNRNEDVNPKRNNDKYKDKVDDADGGVFLDSESSVEQDAGLDFDNDEVGLSGDKSVDTSGDDGAIILKSNPKRRQNTQTESETEQNTPTFNVNCDSCRFSKSKSETSRRDGDFCPQCGNWLSVDRVHQESDSEE